MKYLFHKLIDLPTKWKIFIIFLIAFFIRLSINIVFQGLNSPPDPDMGPDHIEYDLLAQNLALGKGFVLKDATPTTMRPPGVSFLLFPIYYAFGVNYTLARILFCLLGTFTCVVVYFISKKILNETVAVAASLLLAIDPMHFYYSSHLFSEVPWALFMSLAVWFAILFEKENKAVYGILMGGALGMSAYIRPTALFYLPFYSILCFIHYFHMPRKWIRLVSYPLIIMVCSIFPWTMRNYKITHHITMISTHGGLTFWGAHNEKLLKSPHEIGGWTPTSELEERKEFQKISGFYERDKVAYSYGFKFIKNHAKDMPKLELMKLYRLITPFYGTPNVVFNIVGGGSWGILLPFVSIGLWMTLKNRAFLSLHAAVLLTVFITLVFYGDHRFRAAISPFIMVYACTGGTYFGVFPRDMKTPKTDRRTCDKN